MLKDKTPPFFAWFEEKYEEESVTFKKFPKRNPPSFALLFDAVVLKISTVIGVSDCA